MRSKDVKGFQRKFKLHAVLELESYVKAELAEKMATSR